MRAALLAAALLAAAPALAQDEADTPQGTAFDLLRLEPSARSAALAGTGDALADADPAVAFENAALLTDAAHRALSVGYLDHQAGVSAGFASYARTLPRLGTVAAAVRYVSYGDFEAADPDGLGDGSTFGAGATALSLAYARPLVERGLPAGGTLRGGVAVHAAFSNVAEARARAYAADLGLVLDLPATGLAVGAALRGIGAVASSLGDEVDRVPMDLRVTVAQRLRYVPLTISVTGSDLQDAGGDGSALRHLSAGGELRLGRALDARLGYSFRRDDDLASGGRLDLAGLSAGFGLDLRRVAFDYAYHGWGAFGGLHQLALRTRL